MSKMNNKEKFLLTPSQIKQLVHNDFYSKITSQLQDALIMNNLIYSRSGKDSIGELSFDEKDIIQETKDTSESQRDPVDVSGDLTKIDILKTKDQLFHFIDEYWDMDSEEKIKIKAAIREFIYERFLKPQKELKKKRLNKTLKYDYFKHNKKLAEEKAEERWYRPEQKELYKNISYILSGILYKQSHNFLNENGEVNEEGLKFIAKVFLRAIKHIHTLESSKGVHYIFHDGDFHFLRVENGDGSPKVATFDHYIRAIMYLMNQDWLNPFGKNGSDGQREWNNSKNSFLNNLYKTLSYTEETKKESFPDKESIHYNLNNQWVEAHKEDTAYSQYRIPVNRYKTEASRISKLASKWIGSITDESGLRSTYYGDNKDKEQIFDHIDTVSMNYFGDIKNTPGITIRSISTVGKWNFISSDQEYDLINKLRGFFSDLPNDQIPEIGKRQKKAEWQDLLPLIEKVAQSSLNMPLSPAQKRAYELASDKIARGSNGDYQDFKLVINLEIDKNEYQNEEHFYPLIQDEASKAQKTITLSQEISFYPIDNDLNMGNHHFLDLEKKIDTRVSNMNDSKLGKSISLDRLRWFVETTIKDISFDIDLYEEKVKKGLLVPPRNDNYKYLEIDGKRISLKDLISRNAANSERFDDLICHVINYFIKGNKLVYSNMENTCHFWLVSPDILHRERGSKSRRFTIPKVLKNIALTRHNQDPNESESFSFYQEGVNDTSPNFATVSFKDLNKLCKIENNIKKNQRSQVNKTVSD